MLVCRSRYFYYYTPEALQCASSSPYAGRRRQTFCLLPWFLLPGGVGCWDENGGCWRCFLPLQLLQLPSSLFLPPATPLACRGRNRRADGMVLDGGGGGAPLASAAISTPPLLCGSIIEKPPCPLACDDLPLICFFAGAVKGCHAVMHCHAVQLLLLHVHLHA